MINVAKMFPKLGNIPIEVKDRLPHGAFGGWLESEFAWSDRTAQKFINVAKMLVESTNIPIDSKEALYLLAAPSTPEQARQEAITRARNGETIRQVYFSFSQIHSEPIFNR